jgi:hypothetical protein
MILEASSGADMDSIYCTAASSTGNYVRAEGFAIENNQPGSTFANGIVHIRDVVDQARFSEMFAGNIYGDVWHVESACCGASFENIQGASYSGGNAGGIPLTVGPGKVRSVAFYNSTFNSPGSGQPDIKILGDPPTNVMGVDFYNTYMEGNGAYDNTTAMIYIGQYVGPVHFFGGLANTEQTSLTNTKAIFENHGLYLDVPAFEVVNSTLAIDDVTAGTKTAVWDYNHNLGMTPPYSTKH